MHDAGRLGVDEPGVLGPQRRLVGGVEEELEVLHEDSLYEYSRQQWIRVGHV